MVSIERIVFLSKSNIQKTFALEKNWDFQLKKPSFVEESLFCVQVREIELVFAPKIGAHQIQCIL